MMKIYLATTGHKLKRAQALMDVVRKRGHEITHDWTLGFSLESNINSHELLSRVLDDIRGVVDADVLIVVMQNRMSVDMTGTAIEIGVAIGAKKPVMVAEEECRFDHFFSNHPGITCYKSLDCVLDVLYKWRKPVERFEIGKVFRHPSGKLIKIVGQVKTVAYGTTLVGEDMNCSNLLPVGDDEVAAEHWWEVKESEWWAQWVEANPYDDDLKRRLVGALENGK